MPNTIQPYDVPRIIFLLNSGEKLEGVDNISKKLNLFKKGFMELVPFFERYRSTGEFNRPVIKVFQDGSIIVSEDDDVLESDELINSMFRQ